MICKKAGLTVATVVAVLVVAGCSVGDVSTYLGSNARTSHNSAETVITPSSVSNMAPRWSTSSHGSSFVSSQVITSGGVAYWGDYDGYEHATNATSGQQVWLSPNLGVLQQNQVPCPGYAPIGISGAGAIGTVGSRKALFVSGGTAHVYALDVSSGTVIWDSAVGPINQEVWGSAAYFNGSVYVGLASNGDCPLTQGKLFKLNAATGAVQASFNAVPNGCTGGGLWGSPTIDEANNAVYVTSGNPDPATNSCTGSEPHAQAVIKLRADTLAYVSSWQQPDPASTDHDFGSTPTLFRATIAGVQRSLVGAVNKNGIFYAFDRSNLAAGPIWTYQVSDPAGAPEQGQGSIAPAAFDGTSLYIGGGQLGAFCASVLAALDPATGLARWHDCLDGPIIGGVASSPGLVVVGAGQYLEAFNSTTGSQLLHWNDNDPAWYFSVPTISNGQILIAKSSGIVHALRT